MHLIVGWPILTVFAVAALTLETVADSHSRSIVNWIVLPALFVGAVMHLF